MPSIKVGIIGLPNVGKSTLFNALLKKRVALSANYPFATVEPNVGVVAVPDARLEKLAVLVAKEEGMVPSEILKPFGLAQGGQVQDYTPGVELQKCLPPIVPAVVEFVDIAGLVKGASTGAGLGNQFLSHIREVDAIIHVLRDFEDPSASSGQVPIIREGSVDPKTDREIVETELALADLQVLEKLISAQEKSFDSNSTSLTAGAQDRGKLEILTMIQKELEEGQALGQYHVGDERLKDWFKHLPLLSIKPMLFVLNVSEDKMIHVEQIVQENTVMINAKLEEELADFSEEERKDYLKSVGLSETGLERLIKKAYKLLGLISFLTAGKKEVRAWTLRLGETALRAAGVIHTDFEKGFIRAQVIEYEKLIEAGSMANAKSKGWIRIEGRDYIVKDGNVVEFLVSS